MSGASSILVQMPWRARARWSRDATAAVRDLPGLNALLSSSFAGDQIIAVSNREPYSHEHADDGLRVTRPASGLITAVEPVMRACGGTWIAHGGGAADRETVGADDAIAVPPGRPEYRLRRIFLNDAEQRGHADGFSNSGLWPLCHMVHVRPSLTEADWAHYRAVNQRFADAVREEATCDDPVVLVHDYHFALLPAMVRKHLPRATIVAFWHIPWANAEQMGICPWLPELVDGLLGSDILGFQTPLHRRNFLQSVERTANRSRVEPLGTAGDAPAKRRPRRTRVHAYPISIAWPLDDDLPSAAEQALARQRALLDWRLPPDGKLVIGIDRFDYTKGLIERLRSVESLLDRHPEWRGRMRFVQVAAPTRTTLAEYGAFREQVGAEVRRINARFASPPDGDAGPVVLLESHHGREAVDAFYRVADVCLVTSLHDGMNLVSKEFVAARDDERGVLVLSQFAGAAAELGEALIVNPYHTVQVADALHRSLSMTAAEQRLRMRALRRTVRDASVYRWAANMLSDAAALRSAAPPSEPRDRVPTRAQADRGPFGVVLARA